MCCFFGLFFKKNYAYKTKSLNLIKDSSPNIYLITLERYKIFKSYAIINCPLFFMHISKELVNFTL